MNFMESGIIVFLPNKSQIISLQLLRIKTGDKELLLEIPDIYEPTLRSIVRKFDTTQVVTTSSSNVMKFNNTQIKGNPPFASDDVQNSFVKILERGLYLIMPRGIIVRNWIGNSSNNSSPCSLFIAKYTADTGYNPGGTTIGITEKNTDIFMAELNAGDYIGVTCRISTAVPVGTEARMKADSDIVVIKLANLFK